MKFAALLLACVAASASGFSAVAPKAGAGAVKKGDIDRSMKGIDEKGAFDPVEAITAQATPGAASAVTAGARPQTAPTLAERPGARGASDDEP